MGQGEKWSMAPAPQADKGSLVVRFFGPSLFHCNGKPLPLGLKQRTLELLCYLMINAGQEIRRERIAEQIWPDSDEARQRSALNSALWRIAKKLPQHPGLQLRTTVHTVWMTIDAAISVDSRDLRALVEEGSWAGGSGAAWAQRLEAALEASEAPFMDGIDADWALAERERACSIRVRGLIELMHWYGSQRRYEDALRLARQVLCEDPFRESVLIGMMWLYVLNGQRAETIRQYQSFAKMLQQELGIEPMPETQALLHHIRNELGSAPDSIPARGFDTAAAGEAKDSFSHLLAAVEESRREIYQTLKAQIG